MLTVMEWTVYCFVFLVERSICFRTKGQKDSLKCFGKELGGNASAIHFIQKRSTLSI